MNTRVFFWLGVFQDLNAGHRFVALFVQLWQGVVLEPFYHLNIRHVRYLFCFYSTYIRFCMFFKLKRFLKGSSPKNVAVFVDGPNLLRKEFGIDIDLIKKESVKFGSIKIARVYLNQFASDKLVEATVNQGFSPIISTTDVDVVMACDATEVAFNPNIDIIIFATRDSDFLPALIKAKAHGKETIALVAEEMSAAALKNTADKVVFLKGKKPEPKVEHKHEEKKEVKSDDKKDSKSEEKKENKSDDKKDSKSDDKKDSKSDEKK